MQLGMIGLGRMGANLVRRLMRDGHECVVYDVDPDSVRALEREGAVGGVYPWFFTTSGVGTANRESKRMGAEMAAELRAAGVGAALLVAT
jgi:glycine/betaine/sarcosine/D-proline reductase family selenoprotein B